MPRKRTASFSKTRKSKKKKDDRNVQDETFNENEIKDSPQKSKRFKSSLKNSSKASKKEQKSVHENEESNSSEDFDITIMRRIFSAAQYIQKNQKCVQSLYKLIKEVKFDLFYEEFCRNVKIVLRQDSTNNKVKNILDMLSTFLISIKNENILKNKKKEDTLDEVGMHLFGMDTFTVPIISNTYKNLLDYFFNDVLIPYLNSDEKFTRLNTCYLVRNILNHVEDIELGIFEKLKKTLLDRIADKVPNIRVAAALSLYRFQEPTNPNDKVLNALQFHLKYDNVSDVRFVALHVIVPTKHSIPDIILKTRDVKPKIREAAFKKIAKKVDVKSLSIENRLTLLSNGIKDRNESVRNIVETLLIPAWIKSYDGDIIALLIDLDIISDISLIEKLLDILFQQALQTKYSNITQLHLLVEKFVEDYLDENGILTKKPINVENTFFWNCLTKFLKKNEDEIIQITSDLENKAEMKKEIDLLLKNIDDNLTFENKSNLLNENKNEEINKESNGNLNDVEIENEGEEINKESNENENKNENELSLSKPIDQEIEDFKGNLIDLTIPSLSKYVSFFKKFSKDVNNTPYNVEDLYELEFIFKQLIDILNLYDVGDNSQKNIIIETINEILLLDNLIIKFDDYIEFIFEFLSKKVIKSKIELIDYTVEITNKIESTLDIEEQIEDLPIIDEKETRKLELTCAKTTVDIEDCKDKLEEALARRNYDDAYKHKKELDILIAQLGEIKGKLQNVRNVSIRQKPEPENEINIIDHPDIHIKLLEIFENCLKFGIYNNVTAIMDTRINKYVFPGILCTDFRLRYHAIKALNHVCFINPKLAKKIHPLYFQIFNDDIDEIKSLALQGFFDFLCEHSLQILYKIEDEEKQDTQNKNDKNSIFSTTREFTKQSSFLNSSVIDSSETTICENEKEDASKSFSDQVSNENKSLIESRSSDESKDGDENDSENKYSKSFIEDEEDLNDIGDDNDLTLKSKVVNQANKSIQQIQEEKDVIKNLTKLLLKFTRSDCEKVKSITIMGICKLLFMGRLYSPQLLSELILLWYNSNTSKSIQQDIGTFLPMYCFAPSIYKNDQTDLTGQNCLLDCFMKTVENVYRLERGESLEISIDVSHSGYYEVDIDVTNVIGFMLNLLESKNHIKIAIEFCKVILKTLQIERDDDYELKEPFVTRYLIKSLSSLKLVDYEEFEMDELKNLLVQLKQQQRYMQLKKALTSKIESFSLNLNQAQN